MGKTISPLNRPTPTEPQQNATNALINKYKGKKAYIILIELYNEEEEPIQYEVKYNTLYPYALDYKIFKVK